MSAKFLKEYNCKTKQARTLSGTAFSKADFSGESASLKKTDWEYVVRESIEEEILDDVCKKSPKKLLDYIK